MIDFPSQAELIKKYDVPTPRYTSYPAVPFWNVQEFSAEKWVQAVRSAFKESNDTKGISLYVHLPFCESLCTYCACNKRITKNHGVEINYIRSLLREWSYYTGIFGDRPVIRELHLGGGTPTFFSPANLKWLVSYLLEEGMVRDDREFSLEGHPNNTTGDHLEALFDLGFTRVSFGVQDFDPVVQKSINRIQPFENVQEVTRLSRAIGYRSISYDLIYGLPHQTPATIENTIRRVLELRPDRVSFYSYAHVPWVSPGQRGYGVADLPTDVTKRSLYEIGRRLFRESGYEEIGMDHFALPHDSFFEAQKHGRLHRNFMGYTTSETDLLIGLGASAISDAKYAYAQNTKKVESYSEAIAASTFPVLKGHMLTEEDQAVKQRILNVACKGIILQDEYSCGDDTEILAILKGMCNEGILRPEGSGFRVTQRGKAFIRNICSVFDAKFQTGLIDSRSQVFSKSI